MMSCKRLIPAAEAPFHIPAVRLDLQAFPLVVKLLSPSDPDFDLYLPAFEVQLQGNERQPFLSRFAVQPFDLRFMKEELPDTEGIMILQIAVRIGADVHVVDEDLSILHQGVAILHICLTFPQGLYFRTEQDDSGLKRILYVIIHTGRLVLGDDFL